MSLTDKSQSAFTTWRSYSESGTTWPAAAATPRCKFYRVRHHVLQRGPTFLLVPTIRYSDCKHHNKPVLSSLHLLQFLVLTAFFSFSLSRFPIFFISMSTYDDTKAAAAQKSEETKGAAQDFTGAAQQKAGEAGGFAQDKGIQAKDGVSRMVTQAGDAIGNAAQSVADTVNPNKSD
ncbi:uncharacterized protein [Physcomitrium patens]|nr:uncharacterized protein LOC112291135 [Physcomitrium patens]|eukprot:XP_024393954.1 uncharacterized protein LOC112291135 [Physcomitrella patens]